MKRVIVLIIVLLTVSYSVAQTKITLMLNSGLNFPSSSEYFSDYWLASYNFGGGVEIYLNPQLSLLGYIDYNHFSFNDDKVIEALKISNQGLTSSGGGINILNLNADIKYHFLENPQKLSPYILGGIGYINISVSELTATDEDGDVGTISIESIGAFSLTFGFGSEFAVSPSISIFADVRYCLGFTDGSILSYTSDNINGLDDEGAYVLKDNTNYIPFRVGICYKLP